jgi:hypothetical protein
MQIRELILKELNIVTHDISRTRIIECRKKLDLSDMTMNKYMVGNGSKIDVYQAIIDYFKSLQNENN